MPKAAKPGYYVVRKGRRTGIYLTWAECEAQVKGYPGAVHQKFSTREAAETFLQAGSRNPPEPQQATLRSRASRSVLEHPAFRLTPELNNQPKPAPSPRPTYTTQNPAPSADEAGWTIIYTDGACKGNGKLGSFAGSGVWFGDDHPKNLSERTPGDQTNNRAELIAIVRALESCKPDEKVIIKTDSAYSRDCIEKWLPRWRQNGYRTAGGEPVKNKEIILYLSELLSVKPARTFRFVKVQAHVGIHGNECADQLANEGCYKAWREERDDEWDLAKVVGPERTSVGQKALATSRVDQSAMFSDADLLEAGDLEAELNT